VADLYVETANHLAMALHDCAAGSAVQRHWQPLHQDAQL
jgi:hypothetical protein